MEVGEACHIMFKAVSDRQTEVGEACHIPFKAVGDHQVEVGEACRITFKAVTVLVITSQKSVKCRITFKAVGDRQPEVSEACHITNQNAQGYNKRYLIRTRQNNGHIFGKLCLRHMLYRI